MKNIVCPISNDRFSENYPRVTAFFISGLLLSFILTGFYPIILFLGFDFFMRGFNNSRYSLLSFVSKRIADRYFATDIQIDKAPKMFAARLGGVMSVFVLLFSLLGLQMTTVSVATLVAVLSTLECALNFCVGCYIYSWFILPLYKRIN